MKRGGHKEEVKGKKKQEGGVSYVPRAQEPPVRQGLFRGAICSQREGFQEHVMKRFSATSWKALNGMMEQEQVRMQGIASTVEKYSRELGDALHTKALEKDRLRSCPFVLFFRQPFVLSHMYDISLSSIGFSTLSSLRGRSQRHQQVRDGDVVIVKRGVQEILEPFVLEVHENDLLFRPEINYAGGGGGGWSGGGGGGYGGRTGGGGGGGGSFVSDIAKNVSRHVGYQVVKGKSELRGNEGDGSIRIIDVILGDEWLFEYSGKIELWTVPIKSMYACRVAGAGAAPAGDRKGGTGAVIEAQFHFEEGERILVLVGGTSSTLSDAMGSCSGGAGGTFMFRKELSSRAVLVAAGGGGGATDSITTQGSDGDHASMEEQGSAGLGEMAGEGGRERCSGGSRQVSSCYFNAAASSKPAEQELFKLCLEKWSGSLPGGGSGIKHLLESLKGSVLPANFAWASGGFGGGGVGIAYCEQAQLRGRRIDSIFRCLGGSSRIESISLELLGRNDKFLWPPQCASIAGGSLRLVRVDMTSEAGNGVVLKGEEASAELQMEACEVRGCGGNGILVIEQGNVQLSRVHVRDCSKDGVDVKGSGCRLNGSELEITGNCQRGLVVGKGAQVKLEMSSIVRSRWSGVVANDHQTTLSLSQCKVAESKKNGLWILNGCHVELRKCLVLDNESIGILAIGIQDKDVRERETAVSVSHSTIKGNGYGLWSQDAAGIKVVNCAVFGSMNEDIAQHSQPNMKIASTFFSPQFQLGLLFRSWAGISKASLMFTRTIDGLTGEELMRAIEEIFNKMDADGSGRVGVGELREAMEVLGLNLMEDEIYAIIRDEDMDKDGMLSMEEFSQFCYSSLLRRRSLLHRAKIMQEKGVVAYSKPEQEADQAAAAAADDVDVPENFSIEAIVTSRLTRRAIIVKGGRERACELKEAELRNGEDIKEAFLGLLHSHRITIFEVEDDKFVVNSVLEQAQDTDAVVIGQGEYEIRGTRVV
eukprot:765355-Hanusia_phi.AAC.1